jgi:hypothetical protein
MPFFASAAAVPVGGDEREAAVDELLAIGIRPALCSSGTENEHLPLRRQQRAGRDLRLRERAAERRSMPMTSPVDFISGPSTVSTPGNLMNGNTGSFTLTCVGTISA